MTPDSARNIDFVGNTDLNGRGDGVQVMVHRGYAYVGHMFSDGITVIDVADPRWLEFGLSQPQSRRLRNRRVPSDEQKASDPISFVTEEETESRNVVAA